MRILGIDSSLTNFGWALYDTEGVGSTKCPQRGRLQTPASALFVSRYIGLRDALRALVQELRPDAVGVEFPVFGNLYSEGMYGLFLFVCEALLAEGCDVVFWSPLQIKAHARECLGRPKGWVMMKPDMVESARTDTEGGAWNHNEADAYCAARLSARFWLLHRELVTEADLTATERKYFLDVRKSTRTKPEKKVGVLFREDERFFLWSTGDPNGPTSQVTSIRSSRKSPRKARQRPGSSP